MLGAGMKAKIFGLVAAIAILFGLYWLANTAFINISVAGQGGKNISYELDKQNSSKSISKDTTETQFKQRVTRGSYEVTVSQNGKSYFSVVRARGFWSTTQVAAQLQPQKARSFVGTDPENCMHLLGSILVSYTCTDSFSNIKIHKPASAREPTQTVANPNVAAGSVEGIIDTKQGSLVLLQWPSFGETEPYQSIYQTDASLALKNEVKLSGLSGETTYGIKPFREGFVIYDTNLSKVLYYTATNAKPSTLKVGTVTSDKVVPTSFAVGNDSLVALYSSSSDSKKQSSQVVVSNGQTSRTYTFKQRFSQVTVCGTGRLCALGDSQMFVYDISGDKPDYMYSVMDVKSMYPSQNGFLVVRDKDVLNLDINQQQGYVEYSAGPYTINGLQTTTNGYVLNVTGENNKKYALLVNEQSGNNDDIDKKIADLQKVSDINSVSVYGKYIFVTPEIGELTYNDSLQSFTYDPIRVTQTKQAINDAVKQLGIDTSQYTIINTSLQ